MGVNDVIASTFLSSLQELKRLKFEKEFYTLKRQSFWFNCVKISKVNFKRIFFPEAHQKGWKFFTLAFNLIGLVNFENFKVFSVSSLIN